MTDIITINRVKLGRTFVYVPVPKNDLRSPKPDAFTLFIHPESLSTPDESLPWSTRPLPDVGRYIKASSLKPPLIGFTNYDDSLLREFEICRIRNLPFDVLLKGATADVVIQLGKDDNRPDGWRPVTLLSVMVDSATTANPRTFVPWWERDADPA